MLRFAVVACAGISAAIALVLTLWVRASHYSYDMTDGEGGWPLWRYALPTALLVGVCACAVGALLGVPLGLLLNRAGRERPPRV